MTCRPRRSRTSRQPAGSLPDDTVELPRQSPSGVRYFVTRSGQVWSYKDGRTPAARPLHPIRCGAPPHYYWVWAPNKVTVHSLIARAFLGRRPRAHHVMHLNGDVTDNTIANLRYASALEHVRHDIAVRPRRPPSPLTDAERKRARELRKEGQSLSAIASEIARSYTAVQRLMVEAAP
jgi:hypothetical protein